jgi:asparagine synthetase B (glutamine-hydrolysing)
MERKRAIVVTVNVKFVPTYHTVRVVLRASRNEKILSINLSGGVRSSKILHLTAVITANKHAKQGTCCIRRLNKYRLNNIIYNNEAKYEH